jgi:hypothetical protein
VCGQLVKVLRSSRWNAGRVGQLSRHGFAHGPWIPAESISPTEALAMLRMAQLEFEQVHPRWLRAVEERASAAWRAARVGVTEAEIARVYRVPVSNVARMRARVERRAASGGPTGGPSTS